MIFKEDWEKSKECFNAFWEHDVADRPLIAVEAPREKPLGDGLSLRATKDLAEKWTNLEYRADEFTHYCNNTYFGGDLFPNFFSNLGPGTMSACIGGSYKLGEDTVWFDTVQTIKDWDEFKEFNFDVNSEMWQMLTKMTERFMNNANGNYICGVTDIGGNFDILAALRGTQELLYDMYDYGEEVKKAIDQIRDIWFKVYDEFYNRIWHIQKGITSWMPLWCEDKWYPLQCDFSSMLSPEMFAEFVKPALQKEAQFLGKSIYHWDGPSEIPHLDHLLDIPEINGIQWTAGAGSPNEIDPVWYPLFKKIQQKGKNLVLFHIDPNLLDGFMSEFSPEGVYLHTSAKSQVEADRIIDKVARWR